MKKILVVSSMILVFGFIAANAYAMHGCGGYGYQGTQKNTGDYQSFYDDTTDLRISIAADRAELKALIAGDNPDSKRARALSVQISKSEIELRKKAKKFNVAGMGMGNHGMGMMGHGNGMNHGMTGHGHNSNCSW